MPTRTQRLTCCAFVGTKSGRGLRNLKEDEGDGQKQLRALGKVARQLKELHGDWRKPWGEVHRLQRMAYRADTMEAAVSLLPFTASQPCAAAPGPLGVVLTIDSTLSVALIRPPRFAVVGCS